MLCYNKVLQAYTSKISLWSRKKGVSREESSANVIIFFGPKDLHAELPGLNMRFFFLLVTLMTRFGTYPVIQ